MKYTQETIAEIIQCKRAGMKSRQIAALLGVSKSGVNNVWNSHLDEINERVVDYSIALVKPKPKTPKVLFIDVETAPDLAVTFRRFKANIGQDNVLAEGGWLISAAWKWMHEAVIRSVVLDSEEARVQDDARIVATLYDLLEEADVVVGHNIDRFDLPIIKARMVVNGFPAARKVKTVDTLKIAKQMKFQSNRLDSLGIALGEGRKLEHEGIKLWIDCIQGDTAALQRMKDYNEQDIVLLENVYHRIKHMDTKPQNLGLYFDDDKVHCPVCGDTDVVETGNVITTQVSTFAEVKCNCCGARSRTRTPTNTKTQRQMLLL
jgi:transposase-like protein